MFYSLDCTSGFDKGLYKEMNSWNNGRNYHLFLFRCLKWFVLYLPKSKHVSFICNSLQSQHEVISARNNAQCLQKQNCTLYILKFLSQHHSCVLIKLCEVFSNLKQVHACLVLLGYVMVGTYETSELCMWCIWAWLQTVYHPDKHSRHSVIVVLGKCRMRSVDESSVAVLAGDLNFFSVSVNECMVKDTAFLSWAPITVFGLLSFQWFWEPWAKR